MYLCVGNLYISFISTPNQVRCAKMGSIEVDGFLISIGQIFKCPMCKEHKNTKEFLRRVRSGIFKSNDIICNACFDEQPKEIPSKEMKKSKVGSDA